LALSVAPLPGRGAFPVERWPDAFRGRCHAEGEGLDDHDHQPTTTATITHRADNHHDIDSGQRAVRRRRDRRAASVPEPAARGTHVP